MNRTVRTAVAIAASLGCGMLHAQQPGQPDPLFKLDAQSRVQIEAILDSARHDSLPGRPLRSKAYEGIVKQANGQQVLREVRKLFGDLKQARAALGPAADSGALEAGADALYAGVIKPEDLVKFKPGPKTAASPASALTYLSDLIQYRGVAREDATPAFSKLWQDGADDAEFKGLWQSVDQDILSGVSPSTALQDQVRKIP
ncbi:MAG TPA: hypothetical protein VMH39_04315, partial [Gemmatimonadaceae bacterium]|nr:hypothetical protein [Gemmatimonadaceae bacterium]